MSALIDEKGHAADLNAANLQQIGTYSDIREGFAMRGSMSNDYVPSDALRVGLEHDNIGTEVVHYAVIDKAFLKFSDGTDQAYEIMAQVHSNFGYFARTDDVFTRSLAQTKAATAHNAVT